MYRRIMAIIFLFVLLANYAFLPVQAQDSGLTGVDFVFIIDQSGSMGGDEEDNVAANDPLGLRFYGTQYAADWLGSDRLRIHNDATYRMAVVHFGSRIELQYFPSAGGSGHWQTIAPESPENWVPLQAELRRELAPDAFDGHLNYTLPLLAFEDAKALFDELGPDPTRRRVIIVLTDGLPWESANSSTTFSRQHFAELEDFVSANFPSSEYHIYTVAMNDGSGNHWGIGEEYWQRITNNNAELVRTNDDVGVLFRRILLETTSDLPTDVSYTDIEIEPGTVIIPPYLESVEFAFFLADPTDAPQLAINGAAVDPATSSTVTVDGAGTPIQIMRVSDPEPGRWYVDVSPPDTNVNIVMRQIRATGDLLQPTGRQSQYQPLQIQYRMTDSRGNPLREYSDLRYDLEITAEVRSGSDSWQINLFKQSDNSYLADFTPVNTGHHEIYVHAESEDVEGNPIVVYDGSISTGFTVDPVYFVSTDLPAGGRQYEPFTISYELQDGRGQPVSDEMNLNAWVTVESSNGRDEIPLERQADGSYTAIYNPQASGEHVVYVQAEVTTEDGQQHTLVDEESSRFELLPTRLLSLRLVGMESLEQWDTEFFPWVRRPLTMTVEIVDENGNRVDLNEAFVSSPAGALQVDVRDKDGEPLTDVLALRPFGRGTYESETTALGLGNYSITVTAIAELNEGFGYRQKEATLNVERVRHPQHFPTFLGIVAIIIGVIVLVILWKQRMQRLRVHPAVGNLQIVNLHGSRRFRQSLDSFQRNRITFTAKELAETVHVTKVKVYCPDETAHKNKSIIVDVYLNDEKQPSISQKTLNPGGEVKLGIYQLWLIKDPTDAQLEDRSPGA